MHSRQRWYLAGVALTLTSLSGRVLADAAPEPQPGPQPGFIVSYVEAPATGAAALRRQLQSYARDLQQGANAPTVALFSEVIRPNRMVVIERWASFDAGADQAAATLAAQVKDQVEAPVDRRVNTPLTSPIDRVTSASAIHMVTHVDVLPNYTAVGTKLMLAHRDAVLAAPGVLGVEVATQANKVNHFELHEIWQNRAAYDAYAASPIARDFRQQLATMQGAVYDDRLYMAVPSGAATHR